VQGVSLTPGSRTAVRPAVGVAGRAGPLRGVMSRKGLVATPAIRVLRLPGVGRVACGASHLRVPSLVLPLQSRRCVTFRTRTCDRALRLVRLVALRAAESHRRVIGKSLHCEALQPVTSKAIRPVGSQGVPRRTEVMASQAVEGGHAGNPDLVVRMAPETRLDRRADGVDGRGVTGETVDLASPGVPLVAGRGLDRDPISASLMALPARARIHHGVVPLGSGSPEDTPEHAQAILLPMLMTCETVDVMMLSLRPQPEWSLHRVARTARDRTQPENGSARENQCEQRQGSKEEAPSQQDPSPPAGSHHE
jgi:hypothetical protein